MSGNICKDTLETKDFIYTAYRNLLEGNKGWTYSRKNKKTGEKIKLSKEEFDLEIKKACDDYKLKKQALKYRTKIVIEPDGDQFHADCPVLKGLHVPGDTEEEALKNAKDAIVAYIASLIKHDDPIPKGVERMKKK